MKFYKIILVCVVIYIGIVCINMFIVPSLKQSNKEKEMKEVTVFNNYTVKLPIQAILGNTNRWKMETSSSSLTTIIATQTTQANPVNHSMDIALMKHNSQKFKLIFDSERTVDKTGFKVYIKEYKGKAGVSPIRFTCIALDELNTQNRFIFELNSMSYGHSYIVDSIVDSFKRNTSSPAVVFNENKDTFQTFQSAGFKINSKYNLSKNNELTSILKKQVSDNLIGVYMSIENADDWDLGVVVKIKVCNHSDEYDNISEEYYSSLDKESLDSYANLMNINGISYKKVIYQETNALQYSMEDPGVASEVLFFYKNKKSYTLQITTNNNIESKFNDLKSNFILIN